MERPNPCNRGQVPSVVRDARADTSSWTQRVDRSLGCTSPALRWIARMTSSLIRTSTDDDETRAVHYGRPSIRCNGRHLTAVANRKVSSERRLVNITIAWIHRRLPWHGGGGLKSRGAMHDRESLRPSDRSGSRPAPSARHSLECVRTLDRVAGAGPASTIRGLLTRRAFVYSVPGFSRSGK